MKKHFILFSVFKEMQVFKIEVPYTTLHFFNLLEILMSWFHYFIIFPFDFA